MDMRSKLSKLLKPPKFKIEITTDYNDLSDWCKYKALLNLPGHYPWSNRLKYLLLTDSDIIDVNIKTVDLSNGVAEDEFVSLVNYITPINNQITVNYYINGDDMKYVDKIDKLAHILENYKPEPTIKEYIESYSMDDLYKYIHTALIGIAKLTNQLH